MKLTRENAQKALNDLLLYTRSAKVTQEFLQSAIDELPLESHIPSMEERRQAVEDAAKEGFGGEG